MTIRNGDADEDVRRKSRQRKPGVYRASVDVPERREVEYVVHDGFVMNQAHTFPAVEIGDGMRVPAATPAKSAPAADDGGSPLRWLAIPGIALIVAAIAILRAAPGRSRDTRRRRESHHPRRRWPRLCGPGDDDRRLRRRRLRPTPPPRHRTGGE